MEFTDRILKCVNCGEDFVFSAGEQVFFREKQFQHVPRHYKKCSAKYRNARGRVETSVPAQSARFHHGSLPAAAGPAGLVPFLLFSGGAPMFPSLPG